MKKEIGVGMKNTLDQLNSHLRRRRMRKTQPFSLEGERKEGKKKRKKEREEGITWNQWC